MLVEWAYDVRADRLLGKSKWLDSARYDLVAQTQELPRFGELQLMMQALLNARFGLVIHREQRILPFFGLIVDKGGPKMRLSDAEPGPAKNTFSMSRAGRLSGTKVTTAMLANVPSNQVGQSVQDFTGLKGIFDFTLVWAPDGAPQTEVLNALSSLVTAVREQLGLKLESRRGPVDVIVVDRLAASPEAN